MRAIITVVGEDKVGIIAAVSGLLAEKNVNILDISQTIMQDMFTMIMLVDISKLSSDFSQMADDLTELGDSMGLKIHTMHEDIFNCMHHI